MPLEPAVPIFLSIVAVLLLTAMQSLFAGHGDEAAELEDAVA